MLKTAESWMKISILAFWYLMEILKKAVKL